MADLGRGAAALAALIARRWTRGRDRAAARRAAAFARARPVVRSVEPFAVGDHEAAEALAAGEARFAGRAAQVGPDGLWAVAPPSDGWRDAAHGFAWLDDALAAARADRDVLRGWAFDWLRRYGDGTGPGWRPDVAGRRAARLASGAPVLLRKAPERDARRWRRSLCVHAAYLSDRWRAAPDPLGRLEAATGLALAALSVDGPRGALRRGIAAVGAAAEAMIGLDAGVANRCPETLGRAFALLAWSTHALSEAGFEADARALAALKRAGPALRALRLGDGGLARFHGGGAMADGALDQAFALAGARGRGARRDGALGYLRLAAGGVAVVLDAGPPPPDAPWAGASPLALEMSAGSARLCASVGPGRGLGGDWPVAARATAAHSAVEIDGVSAARLAPDGFAARVFGRPLTSGPSAVGAERAEDDQGQWALAEHDGYAARYGLILSRRLNLAPDGSAFRGEDTAHAPTAEARARFDRAARDGGVPFAVRFHLPPDVETAADPDRRGVRLTPPRGPEWRFRASGGRVAIAESVWLEGDAAPPRPSRQIVVLARAEAYYGRVSWSFARATPRAGGPEAE